jgi:hypothetical protein
MSKPALHLKLNRSHQPAYGAQGFLSNQLADLCKIHEPGLNIVMVRRSPSDDLRNEIHRALEAAYPFQSAFSVDVRNLKEDLKRVQKELGRESSFRSPLLFADLEILLKALHETSRSYAFSLRLDGNLPYGCKLFHADYNQMRLLCTYAGPGTEWLKNQAVDRSALGTTNEKIMKPMAEVQKVPTYWVSLIRGELYRGGKGNGLIHKSPAANGKPRLIVAIDPIAVDPAYMT